MAKALHGNVKVIFFSAHMHSERTIANILCILSWHYSPSAGEFGFSVCVIWLRELEKLVFSRLLTLQTASPLE